MANENPSAEEYISHHLTNLTYGQHPDGAWGFAHSAQEAAEMGFMAVNVDTLGFSIVLGALFLLVFVWWPGRQPRECPVVYRISSR